jgi:predicted ATPase
MKLRYLHIKDRPPLKDVELTFRQSSILFDREPERECAIHFVVGVNGTGKSRLLQSLAETFLTLEAPRLPSFPITLAYDLETLASTDNLNSSHSENKNYTVYLYNPGPGYPDSEARLIKFKQVIDQDINWASLAEIDWDNEPAFPVADVYKGNALPAPTSMVGEFLPKILLVYTSGDIAPWRDIFDPPLPLNMEQTTKLDERPLSWSQKDEAQYQLKIYYEQELSDLEESRPDLFADELEALTTFSIGSLITKNALKLAVCAITLNQAVHDFSLINADHNNDEKAFIESLNILPGDNAKVSGLRSIFNQVGWLWPLTLSFRFDFSRIGRLRATRGKLNQLYQLATTVIKDPEPGEGRTLFFDLRAPLNNSYEVEETLKSTIVAQELAKILSDEEVTGFDIFDQLYRWQQLEFLQDITLTLRKHQLDDVLLYDSLSDGEQMFMSRMALLLLARHKQDALIILDEPETHFNDVWKREIVDIIDSSLKQFSHNILISTHSSIALTDVFSEEIELLLKKDGKTEVGHVGMPTFGADPSEIMVNVFGASDSIGKRAISYLEGWLDQEWEPKDKKQLENIINRIGPGLHRSELRATSRELDATSDQGK